MNLTDAEVAIAAAQAGADVVARGYGSDHTRLAKSATDFATETDIDAEEAIVALLSEHRPADAPVRSPAIPAPQLPRDGGSSTRCAER